MKKLIFSRNEVQSYLEDAISMGLATDSEQHAYEDLMWNGKMNKNTYASIVRKMEQEWNNKF